MSRPQVKIFCMSGKPLSQGTYMTNMKALSETVKSYDQCYFFFKVGHRSKSRSQVKFFLDEWEALVTRNIYAKYKGSISNGSKIMNNVKVVQPTNKPRNQQTDRAKTICPHFVIGFIKKTDTLSFGNGPVQRVMQDKFTQHE